MPRALMVALSVALAGSVALDALLWTRLRAANAAGADLSQRLGRVEKLVAAREAADPLTPRECTDFGPGFGDSPDKPCQVEFHRLIEAPQQFAGRWVFVEGLHQFGFETSALVEDVERTKGEDTPSPTAIEPMRHKTMQALLRERPGLWLSPGFPSAAPWRKIAVVGKFQRGPAGHMGMYSGALTDAYDYDARHPRRTLNP